MGGLVLSMADACLVITAAQAVPYDSVHPWCSSVQKDDYVYWLFDALPTLVYGQGATTCQKSVKFEFSN